MSSLCKYTVEKGEQYHIRVFLNGIEANFILDTGATGSVIDKTFAEQVFPAFIKSVETGVGADAEGQFAVNEVIYLNEFEVASRCLGEFTLHIMNLDHINNALEDYGYPTIQGILGTDILKNTIIDLPKGTITYV